MSAGMIQSNNLPISEFSCTGTPAVSLRDVQLFSTPSEERPDVGKTSYQIRVMTPVQPAWWLAPTFEVALSR
jgi:hypothetical protein